MRLEPDLGGVWSGEQRAALQALYGELQAQYPRSTAVFRIPLDYLVCTSTGNSEIFSTTLLMLASAANEQ